MKQNLIKLSFILLSMSLNGQTDCAYENYHYYVSKAQFFNSDENAIQASKYYVKAFQSVDHPFAIHLEAAMKNAITIKNDDLALQYASRLAKGGIQKVYFDNFSTQTWYEIFIDSFSEYNAHFKQNYNLQLRRDILELRHVDSLYNVKYHSWRKKDLEVSFEELQSGAEKIFELFKSMIRTHGFPAEKNAGYLFHKKSVGLWPVTIVMHHLFQLGERVFYDQLGELSCTGYILPIQEASLTGVRGFGKSTGIRDEMIIRWKKYRPEKTPE